MPTKFRAFFFFAILAFTTTPYVLAEQAELSGQLLLRIEGCNNPKFKGPKKTYIIDDGKSHAFPELDISGIDKSKLVPGVERLPYPQYFGLLQNLSIDLGGTTGSLGTQETPTVFSTTSNQIAPVICYESIFGEYLSKYIGQGADIIFIITNDGWWKGTPGYKHHFNFSPVRAIENRRDFVRVANTGISALISARGTIMAATPWWEKATLKGKVHLYGGQTLFARHGDYLGRISLIVTGLLILYAGIRKLGIRRVKKDGLNVTGD